MARMWNGQNARRMVQTGWFATVFAVVSAGLMHAQNTSGGGHMYSYRGPATISVATLRIPPSAWKHFEKARSLAQNHRPEESQKESEKALAIAPAFAAAHILEASQQLLLRDFTGAIAQVDQARKADPNAPWSGLIVAGAYNSMHRYDEAMDAILNLDISEAQTWQAKYERARAAIGMGDVDGALKWSSEAYEATPRNFSDGILVRSNALILAQRWTEASDKLIAYLATGALTHRQQAQDALARVTVRIKAEHSQLGVTVAAR